MVRRSMAATLHASQFTSEGLVSAVRAQLDRMLASPVFRRSPRLSRFLRFVVDQYLNGEERLLKEYSIALSVFGKPDTFDPRLDSAVRVAARQLRSKLDHYYGTEGRLDPVLIRFRPGDYTPRIQVRTPSENSGRDLPDVIVVDGDRKTAHMIAECLDPAVCRLAAVTNDSDRALALIERSHPSVVIAGVAVCGGLTGYELMRALRLRREFGVVAVVSGGLGDEAVAEVAACDPDAVVCKPLRSADVETAMRVAALRAGKRTGENSPD